MCLRSGRAIRETALCLFCLIMSYGGVTLEAMTVLPSACYWHKFFVVEVRSRLLLMGECLLMQNILSKQKESSDLPTASRVTPAEFVKVQAMIAALEVKAF